MVGGCCGGQRFAATVIPRTSNRFDTSVFIYDAAGRQLSAVADTERAQQILWLPMGIVFARATTAPPSGSTEILLVQAAGGLPVSLYRDASYVFINSVVGP
jgi:hypothetical protein